MVATGGSCLPSRSGHAITSTELLLICFDVLSSYALLRNSGVIGVIQSIQIADIGIVLYSLELLLKVLVRHYVVVAS